ncbi:MAG TPA: UDP-N-acetylmuramoyl-L-alanyl-D-glutamate--2,6-diaminopimelate ligase [Gammaproteobacteria bacterium]|nr:UDP-N-acetylmuramoyl-L-alanyl-D-glutamate--2,6-diaminopimelate ligase [Gammaproteobacteria bacterium]
MTAQAQHLRGVSLAQIMRGEAQIPPGRDLRLQGLSLDSRGVHPGYLFLACRGHHHHGLQHLDDARARGAVAVVYDPEGALDYLPSLKELPAFAVRNLDQHAGFMAARFYGDPSAAQHVIAVTGTNGKTSVSLITAQALTELGKSCGVLGTIGYGLYGELENPTHTTPDAVSVQQWLARFRDRGMLHISMEASSHALDQGRLAGVHVGVAVFTNLTREHLDYHHSMESYASAKRRLFETPYLKQAVINLDDAFGQELSADLLGKTNCIGYTVESSHAHKDKTLRATHLVLHSRGISFDVEGSFGAGHIDSRLLGGFNVHNLLAVLGVLLALDIPLAEALRVLGNARTVPGRMECFGGGRLPLIVVDYAHTPDALDKALNAARSHCSGRVWCIFGCGGERDRGKRPQMGAIAERLADRIILTDDNPRHEDGDAIIGEIIAGISDRNRVQVQRNRTQALTQAIHAAAPDDVVLVAGKGHEAYQVVGDDQLPYSDRDTVAALLHEVHV